MTPQEERRQLEDLKTWLRETPIGARPWERKHGETLGFYARRVGGELQKRIQREWDEAGE